MSASKRPSTSSLRRFITSRPFVPVAEIRRRFGLDEPDCICRIEREGRTAYVGLPEREALKLQDLWSRDEVGLELSVEVRAPVVVGIYPMRIARYVMDGNGNGFANGHGNGHATGHLAGHVNGPANGYLAANGRPPQSTEHSAAADQHGASAADRTRSAGPADTPDAAPPAP